MIRAKKARAPTATAASAKALQPAITHRRTEAARKRIRNSPSLRLIIWKNLAVLLKNFPLVTALEIIWRTFSEEGARPNNLIAMVAQSWIEPLRNAQKFSDVIQGAVTDRERLIIAISQDKGNFSQTLVEMYTSEKVLHDIKHRWRVALRDPLVMIVVTWGMLVANAYLTIYQLNLFQIEPDGTLLLALQVSQWIFYTGSWLIPAWFILLAAFVAWLLPNWLHSSRTAFEGLWPFSSYKKMAAANFLNSFTILQASGDSIPSSLMAMYRTAGRYLRWQIEILEPVARTKSIGFAMLKAARRFPDSMVIAQIDIINRNNLRDFPTRLREITDNYTADLIDHLEFIKDVTKNIALGITGLLQLITIVIMLANSLPSQ